MKVFCAIMVLLIGMTLFTGICLLGQWLAWNGPEWITTKGGVLGIGVTIPLVFLAFAVVTSVILILVNIFESKK